MLPQCSGSVVPKTNVPIAAHIYIKINIRSATKPTLGRVSNKASTIFFKAGTTVIILSTLTILSNLATKAVSPPVIGIKLTVTIMKSNMFHPLWKNLINDLSATILIIISIKKKTVIAVSKKFKIPT